MGGDPPVFDAAFRAKLHELFRWRRDVRHFRSEPLPDGALERLVRIASLSPSVGLSEPWRFVSVDSPERRNAVASAFADANAAAARAQGPDRADRYRALKLAGLAEAPCHLAVFVDERTPQGGGLGRATMPETLAYSGLLALHTLWLAARAEGIGLGWVSILDPVRVTAVLEVPVGWRLLAYLCLGFPAEEDDGPELERAGWERRGDPAGRLLRR